LERELNWKLWFENQGLSRDRMCITDFWDGRICALISLSYLVICHVIGITYQRIEKQTLKELLGVNLGDNELAVIMQKKGWKEAGDGLVFVGNQEENIKTKNITEKIDFESVASVLSTYR